MKNLTAYLDNFIHEDDYFESFKKSCGKITVKDFMKGNRKASREEEIENHGKPINHTKTHKSKKLYTRKDKYKKEY